MSPNPRLMNHYDTREVFQEKTAGALSLVERLAGGVLGYGRASANQASADKARMQAEQMNEMLRELELLRVDQAATLLRHTPVPRFAPSYVPPGWDEGMVRMAAAVVGAGEDLAKEAGLGNFGAFTQSLSGAMKSLGGALKSPGAAGAVAKATEAVKSPAVGGALDKAKNFLGGGMGLKTNLALGAAGLGAVYLGNKGIQKATHVMGEEGSGPATYGGGRLGYQLPFGVNSYGQPQVGTPL